MTKNNRKKALVVALVLLIASCDVREDVIFSAFDELHYLQLYKRNNDFEILYNGINTAQGRYTVRNDTVRLKYLPNQLIAENGAAPQEANNILTRVLVIDRKEDRIRSADSRFFCAVVAVDQLNQQ